MRVSGPRPVILTVDDDPGIHDTYRLIFEDRYDLISALDGPAALEILGSQPVDLMLLDIRMRPMNGLVVLEQVRALRPRLPVIVVTVINRFDAGWSAVPCRRRAQFACGRCGTEPCALRPRDRRPALASRACSGSARFASSVVSGGPAPRHRASRHDCGSPVVRAGE